MNVLILGASGFIGRNLFDYYRKQEGNKVLAVCHTRQVEPCVQYDLTKAEEVKMAFSVADALFGDEPYNVIQAAATTSGSKDTLKKPWYHVTDNVIMNSLILREELSHNVDVHIFFSCTAVFGAQTGKVDVDTPIDKMLPAYFGAGWTKIYLERMCEFYSGLGKTKYVAIRHSNVYGPYDKYDLDHSHFLGATITKVMTAEDGSDIVVWGDGKDERDFVYVDDLCDLVNSEIFDGKIVLPTSLVTPNFRLLTFASGENVTVNDAVKLIIEVSGKKLRILNDQSAPSIPIGFSLQHHPKVVTTLRDGIAKTIEWWKANVGK